MSRAWPASAPDDGVRPPRPGALLTAAAAVPLGVAVLVASGLLPWGARVALGVALAVLGVQVRGLRRTVTGARIGRPTAEALGLVAVVGGVVLAAAGLAVGLDGGSLATGADGAGARVLGALPAAASSSPSAAAGVVAGIGTAGTSVDGPGVAGGAGSRASRPVDVGPPSADVGAVRTVALVVTGVGGAVALSALTATGALGLGDGTRTVVLLAAAALAVVVAVRSAAGGVRSRGAAIAAAILIAAVAGEATGLVGTLLGDVLGPASTELAGSGARGARTAVAVALAAALLALAVRRRDPVVGAVPAGILLQEHDAVGAAEQVLTLLVPVVLAVVAIVAVTGVAGSRRRIDAVASRGLVAGAGIVLLVGLVGAFPPVSLRGDGIITGPFVVGLATVIGVLGTTVLGLRTPGPVGVGIVASALLACFVLDPFGLVQFSGPWSWVGSRTATVAGPVLELAIVGVVLARRREAVVLAAAAVLGVSSLDHLVFGGLLPGGDGGRMEAVRLWSLIADLAPGGVVLIVASAVALLGPARLTSRAQALGAGAAFAASLAVLETAGVVTLSTSPVPGDGPVVGAPMAGGDLVAAVLLTGLLLLGVALLATTTARRPSPAVALGTILATATSALLVAAVGAGAVAVARGSTPRTSVALADPALGFRALGSRLADVGGGWPVLLAVLGAVLLGASTWLESRRPVPADAPLR